MFITLLVLSMLAMDGGVDAGTGVDGGVDGGLDAGPVRPARWTWTHADGGWMLDGGFTDVLEVRVGETAEVHFPFALVLMQCNEVILSLGATEHTLLLTGTKVGHTQCGFWFYEQAYPNRSMDVTVR